MDFFNDIPYFFLGFIAIVILEIIVRRWFPRFYYRIGIPLLWRTAPLPYPQFDVNTLLALHTKPARVSGKPILQIFPLAETEFGLLATKLTAETKLTGKQRNYNPLTRAYVRTKKKGQIVEMVVYLNWAIIPFAAGWFWSAFWAPVGLLNYFLMAFGAFIIYSLIRGEFDQYFRVWHMLEVM